MHGTQYQYGPIYTTIYPASGSSVDWTYGVADVVFSYGVELRDQVCTPPCPFMLYLPAANSHFGAILACFPLWCC